MLTRFLSSLVLVLIACGGPSQAAERSLLFLSRSEAEAIKNAIAKKDLHIADLAGRLRRNAEARMETGPWSVTYSRPEGTSAGLHDFFSEGPYWWPDPAHPTGPYIRRDGEVNPNRFTTNDRDLSEMSQTVLTLGLAAWIFDESRYADRAARIISVWFVNGPTRMNPNLEYGQAIRNLLPGRGIGIIDTVPLIYAVQGMVLLEETGRWKAADVQPVRKWFSDYLVWLIHSQKGKDEKMNGNNHSTWWAAQVASYSIFVRDRSNQQLVWDLFRSYLIPHQMRPDGSCPAEESRTKSLGYSAMNLNGFALLCRLAQNQGVDLWHFHDAQGSGVEKAVAYLEPFVLRPEKWEKKQIQPFQGDHAFFLALAGIGLKSDEYVRSYRKLRKLDSSWYVLLEMILDLPQ